MKCPHCQTGINPPQKESDLVSGNEGFWMLVAEDCPECKHTIIMLKHLVRSGTTHKLVGTAVVYPRTASRPPAPVAVSDGLRSLYDEASLVASDSPRAAGALLRRALQELIRDKAGITKPTLDAEITELLASSQLPGYIADIVDAVRVVGNFSAHPIKSTSTAEILDVEPGEVELCFDVMDALFDFYFVEPANIAAKKAALNAKLKEAGKPPLK